MNLKMKVDLDYPGIGPVSQELKLRCMTGRVGCTWEERDSDDNKSIGVNRYSPDKGGVDRYYELWLRDSRKEHLSILGEFGTGRHTVYNQLEILADFPIPF